MMPLTNCKVHLDLSWIEDGILSGDSAKLSNNVSLYWNSHQTIPAKFIEIITN